MSQRPLPPCGPESIEELAQDVASQTEPWLFYLRDTDAYITELEKELGTCRDKIQEVTAYYQKVVSEKAEKETEEECLIDQRQYPPAWYL